MNYKVFYRKYRPTNFKEIIGQDFLINILKKSIIENKISHAYIFTGPRGTGKTSTAKIFAKTINCQNVVDGEPCNKCVSCLSFKTNPDIIEIDAASNNGVDEVRELINNVKITPTNSRYKIYIIDEVHMMTQSAFNALLLTLEEPPKHVIFILATTNIENVPITILSRCQRFDFKKIALDKLVDQIKSICKKENIMITDEAVSEIASLSEGGSRDALSLLDQLSTNKSITVADINDHCGVISNMFLDKLIKNIFNKNKMEINDQFNQLSTGSYDSVIFLRQFIDRLIDYMFDIDEKSNNISLENIKSTVLELNSLFTTINNNVDIFKLIKLIILDLINKENGGTKKDLNQNSIADSKQKKEKDQLFNDNDNKDFLKIRINNCFCSAKKAILLEIKKKWNFDHILDPIILLLQDSDIVAASEQNLILVTELKSTSDLINNNFTKIEKFLSDELDRNLRIVSLSKQEWQKEKKEYINNMKNGVKYKYTDEPSNENYVEENISIDSIACSIFSANKLEIK